MYIFYVSCKKRYRLHKTLFILETELDIQKLHKEYPNIVIHRVRIKPLNKTRDSIPLCRLRCLLLVWPINEVDVYRLKNEFVMGYRDSDRTLYVSPFNNLDEVLPMSDAIMVPWSLLWQNINEKFNVMLPMTPTLPTLLATCSSCRR